MKYLHRMLRRKHEAIFSLKNAIFHVIQDLFWSDIYENDDLEDASSYSNAHISNLRPWYCVGISSLVNLA